jgi:Domain of unknown function (DUF4349)
METSLVRPSRLFGSFMCSALVLATIAACGDDVTVPMAARDGASPQGGGTAPAEALVGRAAGVQIMESAAKASSDQLVSSSQASIMTPSMVIRNGAVTIEVDSLELAVAAVQQVATSMGGYVGNSSQTTGAFNVRTATIELKIPAARYDNAISNLAPIGKIESQESTAEDVGEEFFDITARQANARKLEERLINLLATRTGKLEDVLAVERELARVREEIERYEGRLRYLKSHVATSTLTVTVHEPRAITSQPPGRNVVVESFKDAWRIFVSLVSIAIASLGWVIPLAVLGGIGMMVRKRLKARK